MVIISNYLIMISKTVLKNIGYKLHLDGFIKSQKELLRDNCGGFLIPIEVKIKDKEFEKYRYLPINWEISPITKDDLPEEFSPKAVNTVDMFRRKTYDLDYECIIYFDIHSGNIVFCGFSNEDAPNKVEGDIYASLLRGMHIASAHNHPVQYGSPPFGKNFQMLCLEFEEYELIFSKNELWILDSHEEVFDEGYIDEIREKLDNYFDSAFDDYSKEFDEGFLVLDNVSNDYGNFLLIYLTNELNSIKLTRRYFDD